MKKLFAILLFCLGVYMAGCANTALPGTTSTDSSTIPVPVISDVSYSTSGVTIQWSISDTTDIAYFELYVKSPGSSTYSAAIIIPSNEVSYTSSDLMANGVGQYSFLMSAVTIKNEQGRSSNIYKFNFQGYKVSAKTLSTFGNLTLKSPEHVLVTPTNRIFISDTSNHRILEVTESGSLQRVYGSFGHGANQFFSPMGLALDSRGRILVADSNNDRIVRFDPDNFESTFVTFGKLSGGQPVSGTELGAFTFPVSCAVGPSGEIYVADLNNDRIQKIVLANSTNFSGATATLFGGDSLNPRDLYATPTRLYILDNRGYVYVKRFNGDSDFTMDLNAQALANGLETPLSFRGITLDPSLGEMFVSSDSAHCILVFSLAGNFKAVFGTQGSSAGAFNGPAGMSFNNGKLYVMEKGNKRLQIFQ